MKKYTFVAIFVMLLIVINYTSTSSAVADGPNWISRPPTAKVDDTGDVCNKMQATIIDLSSDKETVDACVIYGKDIDFAYAYSVWATGVRTPAVRRHGTAMFSYMYDNSNALMFGEKQLRDAQLIPDTDEVVYTDANMHRSYPPIVVDNDITESMVPTYTLMNGHQTDDVLYYTFDLASIDGILMPSDVQDANGMQETSYQVSGNGRYIIAYVDNAGVVKYDLETHQVYSLTIMPHLSPWDYVNLPRVEAVSNDGRFVFMAPEGQIIDTKDCGDVGLYRLSYLTHLAHPCGIRDNTAVIKSVSMQSARIQGARFSDDDKSLAFLSTVDTDMSHTITHRIVMNASEVKIIKYLALGDSYSSGEGDVSYSDGETNYLPGTEDRNKCHISYRSYPFLLKEKWGIRDDEMRSVACSGARVQPDYYGSDEYMGQRIDLKDKDPTEKARIRDEALSNFTPGILRQIDFVAKYQPDTITFTGGGNDVGFGEILAYCASPHLQVFSSCAQASDPQVSANLRKTIDDERGPLIEFINKIKEVSPETKVYLIGYPQFISLDGCLDGSELLNIVERQMVRSSVTRLNNILKLVARDADVYYVDIEDSLEGGQICQGSWYMTGPLKLGPQKIHEGYNQEAYHPNAEGHKRIADEIDNRIKNDNLSYTILDIPPEQNGQRVIKKAVTKDYVGIGSQQTIAMDPGMFHGDGTVDIVGFSNRIELARVKAAHDGSLNVTIRIPAAMGTGYHLITLTGESASGDTIQVQQYITVYDTPMAVAARPTTLSLNSRNISEYGTSTLGVGTTAASPIKPLNQSAIGGESGMFSMANDKAEDRESTHNDVFVIWAIVVIVSIIITGALYVTKKEK